jgi:hypothetical protein
LVNAASVATLFLTNDRAICEALNDDSAGGDLLDMGGMM